MINDSYHNHIGYRFTQWTMNDEFRLTAAQKAHAYDNFATEFDALPLHQQPHDGWAETMAYLCRRAACRHRGEPVGEWLPAHERAARRHNR